MLKNRNLFIDEFVSSGLIGMFYGAKNPANHESPLFSIKVKFSNEKDFKHEEDVWKKISKFSNKPVSIPNFYGCFKENSTFSNMENYKMHMVFDYIPKNLHTFIQENINRPPISFEKIKSFFKNIMNALVFLQRKNICHQGLMPENILLKEHSSRVFIRDFVDQENFENSMNQVFREKIFASVLDENFDPYKSNVFALGLIILELGTSKLLNVSKITKKGKEALKKKKKKKKKRKKTF